MRESKADTQITFVREALNKARLLSVPVQTVLDLCAHNDLPLTVTRATLQRFMTGHIETINDSSAHALMEFFATRDVGRALMSYRERQAHPYRLLVNSLLKSALAQPVIDVLGTYYGYHPSLSKSGYAVRAVQIRRELDGLIWFEDYLSIAGAQNESAEVFHNKGLVIFIAEKPQFISIDVPTGSNLRFFVPSDVYMSGHVMLEMTGPMTSWTRTNQPANRHQRLVRVTNIDYESLKRQTGRWSMEDLPAKHRRECLRLLEIEEEAIEALRKAMANGSKTAHPAAAPPARGSEPPTPRKSKR